VVILTTTVVALALLSQVPIAFGTFDYDKNHTPVGFGVLLAAGALPIIRSLQLSLNALQLHRCRFDYVEKKIEAIRSEVVGLIDLHRELFVETAKREKLFFLQLLAPLRYGDDPNRLDTYISKILGIPPEFAATRATPLSGRVSLFIGLCFNVSFQTAWMMYAFSKTKAYLANDDGAASTLAAVTVVSGLYLTSSAIVKMTQRVTKAVLNGLCCRREKSLSEQLEPKLTVTLRFIGLLINLTALRTALVIWEDFFDKNKVEQVYFGVTMYASLFMLLSTSTLDLIDDIVEMVVRHKGTRDDRRIYDFYNELHCFQRILRDSSVFDFSIFVLKLPESLRTQMLQRVSLNLEDLEGCMDTDSVGAQA
jgi:hypothetical protein